MSDDEEDLVDFNIPLGHAPILFALPQNHSVAVGTSSYLGHKKGEYSTWTKPNGEIGIKLEGKVTNNDVFVLCARDDTQTETNFQIMQLLLLLDAINVKPLTAFVSYFHAWSMHGRIGALIMVIQSHRNCF